MTENAQRNREAEVNLLAAAREAQWSAAAFMGPNTMKLVSPAKVNLLLAIGARREDGYHDADTIMHALALHDTLYLRAEGVSADELAKRVAEGGARADVAVGGPADNLVMTIDLADRTGQDLAVPAADNLAFKAADRLSRAVGRDLPEAIQLRIEKHIPAQGGLGGGSSNAAAVLVGLAKAWDLAADDERVADVARSLGADVAFFLHGGCASPLPRPISASTLRRARCPKKSSPATLLPPVPTMWRSPTTSLRRPKRSSLSCPSSVHGSPNRQGRTTCSSPVAARPPSPS